MQRVAAILLLLFVFEIKASSDVVYFYALIILFCLYIYQNFLLIFPPIFFSFRYFMSHLTNLLMADGLFLKKMNIKVIFLIFMNNCEMTSFIDGCDSILALE